jgi:hypothetical protein
MDLRFLAASLQGLALACLLLLPFSSALHAEEAEKTAPDDLAGFFAQEGVFEKSREEFQQAMTQASTDFGWLSATKMGARSVKPGLRFAGLPLMEAIVRLEEDSVARAEFSIFNRGDAATALMRESMQAGDAPGGEGLALKDLFKGPPDGRQFEEIIATAREHISELLEMEPEKEVDRSSFATTVNYIWAHPAGTYTLTCSASGRPNSRQDPFQAEFLNLIITPPEKEMGMLERALAEHRAGRASTEVNREPVKKPNGDVMLENIPMVDQGAKGYCVVASAERVLRWYGRDVDQHLLAQIAQTSAAQGTSSVAMEQALKALTQRFRVRTDDHYVITVEEVRDLVEDYNRIARREKAREVGLSTTIDLTALFMSMDNAVLKEARTRSRSDMGRFERAIKREIDKGIPLLWSMIVGIVEETPKLPQGFGGHMRLIIGYNDKTEELLYTDSWGPGHELKRMSVDNAWTISTGLYSIETF